ncbi:MAG TPA: hypothetical protein PL157_10700 [Acidobacteriota bacterium]|nr:hypothetical protein [Acidobacteriota bacterium]
METAETDAYRERVATTLVVWVGLGLLIYSQFAYTIDHSFLSPAGHWRAKLVDYKQADHKIEIKLEDTTHHQPAKMIYAVDELPSFANERILWSKDETKLLVVGRGCSVPNDCSKLATGEGLYLLYDIPTGTTRCNIRHSTTAFNYADVAQYEFVPPLPKDGKLAK